MGIGFKLLHWNGGGDGDAETRLREKREMTELDRAEEPRRPRNVRKLEDGATRSARVRGAIISGQQTSCIVKMKLFLYSSRDSACEARPDRRAVACP